MEKIRVVLNVVLTIIVVCVCSLAALNYFSAPERAGLMGYRGYTVISGSMEPTLHVGDYIIIKDKPYADIQKGTIISFRQDNVLVTHRVVAREGDKLQTRGDHNNVNDLVEVTAENYVGTYQFRIPQLGCIMLWLQDPMIYSIIMAVIALRIAILLTPKK